MTIDERLDRLTERHEALTQSVELLAIEMRELREIVNKNAEAIGQNSQHINALVRIAEIHERRLTDLEGGER